MKPLPRFTAVVHVASDAQAVEQTDLALSCGAGGVFLINHGSSCGELVITYRRVRERFPDAWIGMNFLGLDADAAIRVLPAGADALWMDNMGDLDASPGKSPDCLWRLFGGAAFKYQRRRGAPEEEARQVARRLRAVDVVTTSGPGTGEAATPEKVRRMKEALAGDGLLALASGVTPENVASFAPFVDCFLVATGISQSFHEFDPAKVRALAGQLEAEQQSRR